MFLDKMKYTLFKSIGIWTFEYEIGSDISMPYTFIQT